MSVPLNQTYRIEETLAERPDVLATMELYEEWLRDEVAWRPWGPDGPVHVGRSYDAAIALVSVDFASVDVLEIGARASFLSPFVTDVARSVFVTDLFGASHPQLGTLNDWEYLWTKAARRPDRLRCGIVDMQWTWSESELYDVILNISAIEHVTNPDGDTQAMIEMARLCRSGGFIVVGTDVSDRFRRVGGYYYDERALYERLIEPSGCELYGPMDLSWEAADKSTHKSGKFEKSCCIFILRKP